MLGRIVRAVLMIAAVLGTLVYFKFAFERFIFEYLILALGGWAYFEILRKLNIYLKYGLIVLTITVPVALYGGLDFLYHTEFVWPMIQAVVLELWKPMVLAAATLITYLWIEEKISTLKLKRAPQQEPENDVP